MQPTITTVFVVYLHNVEFYILAIQLQIFNVTSQYLAGLRLNISNRGDHLGSLRKSWG